MEVGAVEGNGFRKEPDNLVESLGLALLGLGVEDVRVQDLILDRVVELEGFNPEKNKDELGLQEINECEKERRTCGDEAGGPFCLLVLGGVRVVVHGDLRVVVDGQGLPVFQVHGIPGS